MKTTTHYKGHRWSDDEIKKLMKMWQEGATLQEIGTQLELKKGAILKQVQRLRKNGIPLSHRKSGNSLGIVSKNWTQGEIEYLRRRNEKASSEEIGNELGRSSNSIDAMIQKLRKEDVPVVMRGSGVRRLYDLESLKAVAITEPMQ